jgi:hypothetical protein
MNTPPEQPNRDGGAAKVGSHGPVALRVFGEPPANSESTPQPLPQAFYPREPDWEWLRAALKEKAYGAPRVFDLFTLMSVTLAFGLLFSLMKALDASPEVFISVSLFVTLIAVSQMLFFGGNSPRLASLVGGSLAIVIIFLGLGVWYQLAFEFSVGILCLGPLGIPLGYLAGGLIAGVFLVADLLRAKFTRTPQVQVDEESSDSFWE